MKNKTSIKLFEQKQVRSLWNDDEEKWYFSIVDVIQVLTETKRPRKYWNDLKVKLKKEGSELSDKIGQLKMLSSDGKFYNTDIADTELGVGARMRSSILSGLLVPSLSTIF